MQQQGQPFMLNLDSLNENPKYITSIRQANNGFAINVEWDIPQKRPISEAEAQRKIAGFMQGMSERMDKSQDPILSKIENEIEEEEQIPSLIGPHVFYTFPEVVAFLAVVYKANEDLAKK